MSFGFTRKIEEVFIDMDKLREMDIVDANVNEDPNGMYTVAVVPSHLVGKRVMIIPIDEDDKVMSLDDIFAEAKI